MARDLEIDVEGPGPGERRHALEEYGTKKDDPDQGALERKKLEGCGLFGLMGARPARH